MKILHGLRHLAMSHQLLNGFEVDSLVEQVGGKTVPYGVYGILFVPKTCLLEGLLNELLNGSGMDWLPFLLAIEQKDFRFIQLVIGPEFGEQQFGKGYEAVFPAFPLHNFNAHLCAVDMLDF